MQRLKRIGLLILTNLFIIIGVSILLFVLEKFFGFRLGGSYGSLLVYAAMFGFAGSIISLYTSKRMAKKMYHIQLIDNNHINYNQIGIDAHKLHVVRNCVSNIAQTEHMTMPEVGFYISDEPNAFATGPSKSNALVAVSSGLLDKMTDKEIQGVVAHEMAHIINGDMLTMTLLQGIMNTFVFFLSRVVAGFGSDDEDGGSYNIWLALVLEIIFGVLGSIVVNQYSQYREYRADAGSATLLGDKNPMIQTLQKLQLITKGLETRSDEYATMKIFGHGGGLMRLFATHPSLENRIAELENN